MATFSTNQVRHLYVANAYAASVTASSNTGTISAVADTSKNHLYFGYKGADNLMRSDLITTKNIIHAKATDADKLATYLKSVTVALDSSVNGGAPLAGQDYILRIAFRQYIGMSDTDQYFKYGMVHAYTGLTASNFYKTLALSLVKNFSRELYPLVSFQLKTASSTVDVTTSTTEASLTGTYTGVIINEVEQEWVLGTKEQVPVYFEVQPGTITVDSDSRIWGTVTVNSPIGTIINGKKIADLEYFTLGDRGDIYRKVGFPNYIPTTYLVDPTKKYNVIDIHYSYVGDNESVQKSEKTITIVVPKVGATNSVSNVLTNTIIAAINTATGLSIATLGVETT